MHYMISHDTSKTLYHIIQAIPKFLTLLPWENTSFEHRLHRPPSAPTPAAAHRCGRNGSSDLLGRKGGAPHPRPWYSTSQGLAHLCGPESRRSRPWGSADLTEPLAPLAMKQEMHPVRSEMCRLSKIPTAVTAYERAYVPRLPVDAWSRGQGWPSIYCVPYTTAYDKVWFIN